MSLENSKNSKKINIVEHHCSEEYYNKNYCDSDLDNLSSDLSDSSLDSFDEIDLELDNLDNRVELKELDNKVQSKNNKHKDKKLYLGHHMNTLKWGFDSTIEYLERLEATFFQIFLSNPKRFQPNEYSDEVLLDVKQKLIDRDIKLVVHANYMLNFCNPNNSVIHMRAVHNLTTDLKNSIKIGAIGVVVHMGKNVKTLELTEEMALDNYVLGIKTALKNTPKEGIIIFETAAAQGTEICYKFSGLQRLYNKFTEEEKTRIKFCIDTCHIFAAGYDIGDHNYVEIICQYIDKFISWDKVACIHLNDSKCPLGSRRDRHADIGKGYINLRGLKKFVRFCYRKGIPITLETPCENGFTKQKQISFVRSWIN